MFVDSKKSDVTVWLAKFPPYLAQKILELPNDTNIGALTINKSNTKRDFSLILSTDFANAGIPVDYTVQLTDISKNMYVLKMNKANDKSVKIDGSIKKECKVCPVINEKYFAFKRSQKKSKVLFKTQDDVQNADMVKELEALAKKRKRMLQEKKRERMDKNEVMDILFRAFETNESWTVKELADFSGQPVAYINEIMPEVGVLNKKDQRNVWELKDEYKFMKKK